MEKNKLLCFLVLILLVFNNVSAKTTALMVFVSSSMPKMVIQKYKQQQKKYNAVMLMQGLIYGSFQKTKNFVGQNALIQIDQDAFEIYKVTKVPTIILAYENDQGNLFFDKVEGNMNIDAALEIFIKDGDLSDLAKAYLDNNWSYIARKNLEIQSIQNKPLLDMTFGVEDIEKVNEQTKKIDKHIHPSNKAAYKKIEIERKKLVDYMNTSPEESLKDKSNRTNLNGYIDEIKNNPNTNNNIQLKKEIKSFFNKLSPEQNERQ